MESKTTNQKVQRIYLGEGVVLVQSADGTLRVVHPAISTPHVIDAAQLRRHFVRVLKETIS